MDQLALFQARLPVKPYHTDDLTNGLSIVKVQHALKSRYIQPNGPTHKYWLVFDVDTSTATMDWYDLGAPAPNIIATNTENGHAHLIYGFEGTRYLRLSYGFLNHDTAIIRIKRR